MSSEESGKTALRLTAAGRRATIHATSGASAGAAIARNFLENLPWKQHSIIAGYLPMRDEADVMPLLRALADAGANLALPVVPGRAARLQFRFWQPGDPLQSGAFGTSHPPPSAEPADPDLLLVPMLAWDDNGHRLGYGGGYYDRTLAELRRRHPVLAVGIAFAEQFHPHLPYEEHDQRLDWLVTEQGAKEFGV
jgi:5-formyltetrahydrofolate cyclo-ligase